MVNSNANSPQVPHLAVGRSLFDVRSLGPWSSVLGQWSHGPWSVVRMFGLRFSTLFPPRCLVKFVSLKVSKGFSSFLALFCDTPPLDSPCSSSSPSSSPISGPRVFSPRSSVSGPVVRGPWSRSFRADVHSPLRIPHSPFPRALVHREKLSVFSVSSCKTTAAVTLVCYAL